jgi:hypothetical protein
MTASIHNDLAAETSNTTGTGSTIALTGAVPGMLTFAQAGYTDGQVLTYGITDDANSETGQATYSSSGPSLTSRTVSKSTNSNAAINLSGTQRVFALTGSDDTQAATAAQVKAGTNDRAKINPKALRDAEAFYDASTGSGSWAPDRANGPKQKRVLNGNSTLANMTNAAEGDNFYFRIAQNGTGGYTLAFGSGYKFAGGAPDPSVGANDVDAVVGVVIDAGTPLYDCAYLKDIS